MTFRRFLFASTAFILLPTAAFAEPISGAILAIQAFAASSAIAGFAVQMATSFVFSSLAAALSKKDRRAPQSGIKTESTTAGGTNPQTFILGKYATSGNLAAPLYSHPNSGSLPNKYLTYVVDVSDLPGVEFSRLIVNGEYVSDFQNHDGTHDLEGYFVNGTPHAFLTFHDGTQATADPYMMEHYATYPSRPWSADMVGEGISYAVVTFLRNQEVFNSIPSLRFECLGVPLYDPRLDSSVGGDGAQRWDDRTTWAFTENPVVMIYNILRGIELPDGRIWGGSVPSADLPLANWFHAMNECDVSVDTLGGGTRPQYRAGFEVSLDMEPLDVIDHLENACSGRVFEAGGVYKVRVGASSLPVLFVSDADVSVDDPEKLTPHPGLAGVHNGIQASHPTADAMWEAVDAPAVYNDTWEAEDGGRRLVASLDLPAVATSGQAQQLMHAWIKDARRFRQHTLTLASWAAVLEPMDVIGWTSERHGYSAKPFEIGEIADDLTTCLQGVSIRERDSGDFIWSPPSDEIAVSVPSALPVVPVAWVISGFGASADALIDGQGRPRRVAISLSWNAQSVEGAAGIKYRVRRAGETQDDFSGVIPTVSDGRFLIIEGLVPSQAYEVSAELISDRQTVSTPWLPVVTGDILLGVHDLDAGVFSAVDAVAKENVDAFRNAEFLSLEQGVSGSDARIQELAESSALAMVRERKGELALQGRIAEATFELMQSIDAESVARAAAILTLQAADESALAEISNETMARVSGDDALATDIAALSVETADLSAAVVNEAAARIDGDQAAASALASYAAANDQALASVTSGVSALVGENQAQATSIVQLTATLDGNTSAINQQSTVIAGLGASVQYSLDVNGHLSGWAHYSDVQAGGGVFSNFVFVTDAFQIVSENNTAIAPFSVFSEPRVINGKTVPAGVYVNGRFTTDQLAVTGSMSATYGEIGHFKSAASGERVEIKDDRIEVYDASGNIRVRIGNLS